MKKFVLPEKWHIASKNDEEDRVIVEYINNTFNLNISPGLSISMSEWWYANYSLEPSHKYIKHDSGTNDTFKNHSSEITYDQFVNYVLNEINNPCEHDPELETILKRLLE